LTSFAPTLQALADIANVVLGILVLPKDTLPLSAIAFFSVSFSIVLCSCEKNHMYIVSTAKTDIVKCYFTK
jgi:hypothetical protein